MTSTIENTVQSMNTVNTEYNEYRINESMMRNQSAHDGKVEYIILSNIQRPSSILIGCIFYGMV